MVFVLVADDRHYCCYRKLCAPRC